jgi:hypothetical protein
MRNINRKTPEIAMSMRKKGTVKSNSYFQGQGSVCDSFRSLVYNGEYFSQNKNGVFPFLQSFTWGILCLEKQGEGQHGGIERRGFCKCFFPIVN